MNPTRVNPSGRVDKSTLKRQMRESWEELYDSFFARTEYNKKKFSKRIKQLLHMKTDNDFKRWLYNEKQWGLEFLAKSGLFDDDIGFDDEGDVEIINRDFGYTSHISKMLIALQSDSYMDTSIMREQAKRYVELYMDYLSVQQDSNAISIEHNEELPF